MDSINITFTKQIVDTTMEQTHAVVAADFDGDNDLDLVATNFILDYVAWYENDGNGSFSKKLVDGNLNGSLEGSILEGAYPVNVGDVNNDGYIDILAAGYDADTVVWYQNDGSGNFTRHDVDTNADGAHSVLTRDLDQDGDNDLLTTNQDEGTVVWYENDGSETFTKHFIDENLAKAKYADSGDIDGDGDIDIFAAGWEGLIAWYENDGSQNFTRKVVDNQSAEGAYFVFPIDFNKDGSLDVVSALQSNQIIWYQNDGSGNFTEHIIDNNAKGARSVFVVDLDNDGNLDVLSTSVDDDTVAWYRHDGSGNFTKEIIDDAAGGAYGVFAADIDGDGLTDVLSASRDDNAIAWYRQSGNVDTVLDDSPIVTDPISDLIIPQDTATQTVDLTGVFSDPDGDEIEISLQNNSNPELVSAVLDGSDLNLSFFDGQFGTADITIRGTANGQFVDDTFTVTLGSGDILNNPIYRFQSSQTPGTYLFVGEEEKRNINQNFANSFVEEGIALNATFEPNDDLITLYRFQSNETPGTYLFVGEQERNNINADPNLSNAFTEEGIGFYVYSPGAGEATSFYRFQNSSVPGTYLYATGTEVDNIRANFPNFIEEGIAFEARVDS